MEKLVLIDGNSLINRAFYAMPVLSTKKGEYTNAVYGFMNMFFKILSDLSPTYLAVAFDMKAPTFRHKTFAEYKGTRKPMPEELRPQIPLLKELLKLMEIEVIEQEGVEADDIIGTIAKNTDILTYIFTGDKDSFQLVDEQTEVHFTKRGITDVEIYTLENFKQKTGINPAQVIDLKSLMGDSSDNIPGVSGVGEKTALNLVQQFGNLENVYANIEEISGKLKQKLIDGEQIAKLSKMLATIKTDCNVNTDVKKMAVKLPFKKQAKDRFLSLEFKSAYIKNEKFFENEQSLLSVQENFIEISTEQQNKFTNNENIEIVKIEKLEQINSAITEYINSNEMGAFAIYNEKACFYNGKKEFQMSIMKTLLDDGFSLSEILESIRPIFNCNNKIVTFCKKQLRHLYRNLTVKEISPNCEDVSIIKYLADYSGKEENITFILEQYDLSTLTPAYSLYKIFFELKEKLISENNKSLYYDVELPLSDVLYDMETTGFKIDYQSLEQTGKKYQIILADLEKEIREIAEEPTLNVNSPKQLGELLFVKLKLAKGKKNKNGFSTAVDVLESIEDTHPVISKILKYRQIQKLQSTYVEGLKVLIDKKQSIVNTSFNQTVTSTGRLSSKEPNLQNIPVRDEEGKELRKFFVARDENHILVSADYSQIELRLLAAFSGCSALVKAFNDNVDIHSVTAAKVFGVEQEKVTSEMRSSAKAVNFGIIYGISEYGLAKNIKCSPSRARELINTYFLEYPEVKEYMNNNVAFAKQTGYAKTLLGRRRYIKEINSSAYNLKQFGERAAMNMPLQGSSADIIKLAMLGVAKRLKEENLQSKLILQIHDELIVDTLLTEKEKIEKILVQEMENVAKLSVPLNVNLGSGYSWFDAK